MPSLNENDFPVFGQRCGLKRRSTDLGIFDEKRPRMECDQNVNGFEAMPFFQAQNEMLQKTETVTHQVPVPQPQVQSMETMDTGVPQTQSMIEQQQNNSAVHNESHKQFTSHLYNRVAHDDFYKCQYYAYYFL